MPNPEGLRSLMYDWRVKARFLLAGERRRFRRKRRRPETVRDIAILVPDGLGDTVVAFPMILELMQRHPDANFVFITATAAARAALKLIEYRKKQFVAIDEYKKARLEKSFEPALAYAQLRGLDADLVYTTAQARFPAYQLLLDGFRHRWAVGISNTPELLDEHVTFDETRNDKIAHLELIGAQDAPVFVGTSLKCEFMREFDGLEKNEFVLIDVGTKDPSRVWDVKNFLALAEKIRSDGMPVVFTGGPAEARIMQQIPADAYTAFPGIGMGGLLRLIKDCAHMVCINSGPMHLADLCDVKMTVLIERRHLRRWAPVSRDARLLVPDEGKFVRDIAVAEVYDAYLRR